MRTRSTCYLVVLFSVLLGCGLSGCWVGVAPYRTEGCEDVSCSGHGVCELQDGAKACVCEAGFSASGLECVAANPAAGGTPPSTGTNPTPPSGGGTTPPAGGGTTPPAGGGTTPPVDPCNGQTCSGHGTCAVNGGVATCTCQTGFHAEGMSCLADQTVLSFSVDISPINKSGCSRCHSAGQYGVKIAGAQSDHAEVMRYVDKANPEKAGGFLSWAAGYSGHPSVWKNTSTQYKLFLDWVKQGAQNN